MRVAELAIIDERLRRPAPPKGRPSPNGPAPLAPLPIGTAAQAFLSLAKAWLCRGTGTPAERGDVTFSVARQYFQAQHWEEAATWYHDVAAAGPPDVAIYAALLSLESLNLLAYRLGRGECAPVLEQRLDAYIERLCRGPERDPTSCGDLERLQGELRQRARP